MKLKDWTIHLKPYEKPNYGGQFMTGTFLPSALKVLSEKNLYIADDTNKLCFAIIAGLK